MTELEPQEGAHIETDFSLEDEYKPDPLAPQGNYLGSVAGVTFEMANQAIAWRVVLADNGGVMSDGETPIDGQAFTYRNWLPRIGDENKMTASGRSTKRQAKINMMKQFADSMQINMDSPTQIMAFIESGDWVGIDVVVSLSMEEYQGRTRNSVSSMARRASESDGSEDDIPF